jgi:hypothetical protein
MRYCTRCGTTAGPQQAFCIRCGAPLGPSAEPSAPSSAGVAADPAAAAPEVPSAEVPSAEVPANWSGGRHQRPDPGPPAASAGEWYQHPEPGAPPARGGGRYGDPRPEAPTAAWNAPVPGPAGVPAGDQRPGRKPGRRTTVAVALAVLVLVLGGGAVTGWKLLGHRTAHLAGSPSATGAAGVAATSAPPDTASPGSGTPGAVPGAVVIGPAVSQMAGAPQVAAFLDAYFQAINTRDYSSYSVLFTPALRSTPAQFQAGYGSTSDSDATLTGITPTAAGVAAAVTFTSHQQPADSPTGTSCTAWDITLYLEAHGSSYWIVHAPADYHAQYQPC